MGKYTFTYTKKEFMEFCVRAWWDMRRKRPVVLLGFLLLLFIYSLILKRFPYEFLIGFVIGFVICFALEIGIFYIKNAKKQLLQERSIWIEDGILKSHTPSSYHETPCSQISRIIESKRLLMLGVSQTKNQTSWFVIPTRVFSNAKEQYDFIQNLKSPVSVPLNTAPETEDFHFSFFMDIDKWVRFETEARFVFRDRASHNFKTVLSHLIYYILLYISCICFLYLLDLGSIFSAVAAVFFIALLPLRRMLSPEKAIRKNMQNSSAQSNLLGNWDICFTASGISYSVTQKSKVFLPWTEFSLIAETEHAFYILRKDSRQFIPLPKSCLSGYEQALACIQYCRMKGLLPVQIQKARYVPHWLFRIMIAFSFCILLTSGMWHAYRKPEPVLYDSPTMEMQVSILRSLGLTISDERIEEILPEDETIREIIKDYPYTWLLTSLGMPEHNENFEITGYSEEVFWFDYEGWDLETDYIHILEGMAALAKGSAIDQVENIRVDTTNVDWEEGRGTLTVTLDYNGKTLSYPMKVLYDWIDSDVLNIYNTLLKDTNSAEYFYAMGDDGQGVIIFFCSEDWADHFEKMTNIKLEKL